MTLFSMLYEAASPIDVSYSLVSEDDLMASEYNGIRYQTFVVAPYTDLLELFGNETLRPSDGVPVEYILRLSDGELVSIYFRGDDHPADHPAKKYRWSIASHSFYSAALGAQVLERMIKPSSHVVESLFLIMEAAGKNTHLEHAEDLVIDEGADGAKRAVRILSNVAEAMFAGEFQSQVTVKYDGSPAIVVGNDPADGLFFVATKGAFNKSPKVYKSRADLATADMPSDLRDKMLVVFDVYHNVPFKAVVQGDLLFTKSSVSRQTIDGQSYLTFQPNTIMYAVPERSDLGEQIKRSDLGVIWHTRYEGKTLDTMQSVFDPNILSYIGPTKRAWQDDATYKVAQKPEFTQEQKVEVARNLQAAATEVSVYESIANETPSPDDSSTERTLLKQYINSLVRAGTFEPSGDQYAQYVHKWYTTKIEKLKTPAGRSKLENSRDLLVAYIQRNKKYYTSLFSVVTTIASIKHQIVRLLNQSGGLRTMLRTTSGIKPTNHEGFVAIDQLSNGAVKLVDRAEFSAANFSKDVLKGWER